MKQFLILKLLLVLISTINANNVYLDIGLGVDIHNTNFMGMELSTPGYSSGSTQQYSSNLSSFIDARIGYFINNHTAVILALQGNYLGVAEYDVKWSESVSIRFREEHFVTYLGLGIIYYPSPVIQLSCTAVYSGFNREVKTRQYHNFNDTSFQYHGDHWESGLGFDISVAYDIKFDKVGVLLGARFFNTTDSFFNSNDSLFDIRSVGLFIKCRYY